MRKFQQSEVELRNNLAHLIAKLEEENSKQEDEKVLFAIDKCWENRSPHKRYCTWVVKLLNYLKSEEEKSKLQTEMKLSREEMELAMQGVLQEKEILEIRGNGKSEIESMIVESRVKYKTDPLSFFRFHFNPLILLLFILVL